MKDAAEFDRGMFIDTQRFAVSPVSVIDVDIDLRYFRYEFQSNGYNSVVLLSTYDQDLQDAARDMAARGFAFHDACRVYDYNLESRRVAYHNHIVRKMQGVPRNDRLSYARNRQQAHRKLQELGANVGALIRGEEYNVIDVLEHLRNRAEHSAQKVFTALEAHDVDLDEVRICDDCGAYHHEDDSNRTIDGNTICESCREDYRYSECMEGLIPEDAVSPVYDSARAYCDGDADDYCTTRYGDSHFNEFDGVYFSDIDAYYEARGGDDEDEDEDEDDNSAGSLDGYHSADRYFTERNVTPSLAALGVELEVYAADRSDVVESLRDNFDDLILEKDGSLDEDYGFEIVTQPYGPSEWADLAPQLLKHLREQGAKGYQTPGEHRYGIHVNVHRRHFSPLAEARIMFMLCDRKNRDFVRAIAQRENIYSANMDMGCFVTPSIYNITDGGGLRSTVSSKRKLVGAGRYCPINWQSNIAEFRIFNSTLNEVSFMKNLEFVWALIGWTKDATGSSHDHRDFIKWMNTPQQRRIYPNLINYLSRKAFFTKGGNRIENTWLPLLNKPVDLDTSELLLAA